jgi:His/Glu/Gln/Arg/opine family amino acid ABC transporter permease subunit
MHLDGFILQLLLGAGVTLQLACAALVPGLAMGLAGAFIEFLPSYLSYPLNSFIFIIRGLPELLVLFFIYFGLTALLSQLTHHYVDISPFAAGVAALGLLFGVYATAVFKGAFAAIDPGQVEAGKTLGLSAGQIFFYIQLPQAWRHAIPGLGNLWLVLLKDTAIVSLIGVTDMMNQAKTAASTTHQPFTFYLMAAVFYLVMTHVSQKIIHYFTLKSNRFISS